MKASIKFRDEQKPLIRAKVPLSILGLPFQSGVVAGESKELSLNLSTFFDSGPSFKFCYRPNDSFNPFSLVFKSGIGHFGSPISSSITMSAEFNLIGSQNPSFFVHFKPQLGDFTVKKSQSSIFAKSLKPKTNGVVPDEGKTAEVVEMPAAVNNGYFVESGLFPGKKFTVLPPELPSAGVVKDYLSGMEMSARSCVPLKNCAVMNFRWGVRLPKEDGTAGPLMMKSNQTAWVSLKKFPFLVMNKIGIEHVAQEDKNDSSKAGRGLNLPENATLAEVCLDVKHQLEVIQSENGMLRKGMDDLRSVLKHSGGGKVYPRSNWDKKSWESKGVGDKKTEGDANEEEE